MEYFFPHLRASYPPLYKLSSLLSHFSRCRVYSSENSDGGGAADFGVLSVASFVGIGYIDLMLVMLFGLIQIIISRAGDAEIPGTPPDQSPLALFLPAPCARVDRWMR